MMALIFLFPPLLIDMGSRAHLDEGNGVIYLKPTEKVLVLPLDDSPAADCRPL
jgi:hypothetical protein